MKKIMLLLTFSFITGLCFSQTYLRYFNPFSFDPFMEAEVSQVYIPVFMAVDTFGNPWFSAFESDTVNVQHFVNQTGSTDYKFGDSSLPSTSTFFVIDSRNDFWYQLDSFVYRGVGGSFSVFSIPGHSGPSYTISQVVDDHNYNDYILSVHSLTSGADSFFVTKFDGSTYTTIYLNSLGIPFNDTIVSDTTVNGVSGICDYNGVFYLNCGSYGLMVYAGGNWTHLPATGYQIAANIIADHSNNIYFASDSPTTSTFITVFNGSTFDSIAAPTLLDSNMSASFALGGDGHLWVLTDSFLLFRLNSDYTWATNTAPGFTFTVGLAGTQTVGAFESYIDPHGLIWVPVNIGTPNTIAEYDPSGFSSISGTMYDSVNNAGVSGINILQEPDGFIANTDSTGYYTVIILDTTVAHTVSTTAPMYYHISTASSYTIPAGDSLCCYTFGIAPNGNIPDLSITVCSAYPPFPGDTNMHWLCYQNVGTIAMSDTITYAFDTAYSFVSASPAPAYRTGHTAKWAYTSLQPFGSGTIAVTLVFDTTAQATDTIISIATIGPVSTDYTPANNIDTLWETAVNSFDPNLKTVKPTSGVNAGEPLVYTIHFQNTGTAAAQNIVVRDTLDGNLNAATFRLLGSSSPVTYTLKGAGIVEFYFNDIRLPDSAASQAGSHGFVEFSVNVKSNLSTNHGTEVNNRASIYFDYNPPVATNVATATFSATAGILSPMVNNFGLKLIPNPTKDFVTVIIDANIAGGSVQLMDATGRVVLTAPYELQNVQLRTSQFSSGLYFVKVTDAQGHTAVGKLVIEQ